MCENNPQAQVKGIVVLHDVGEATAQHARMMNPVIAKKGLTIFEEAYPARPKVVTYHRSILRLFWLFRPCTS